MIKKRKAKLMESRWPIFCRPTERPKRNGEKVRENLLSVSEREREREREKLEKKPRVNENFLKERKLGPNLQNFLLVPTDGDTKNIARYCSILPNLHKTIF